MLRQRSRVDRPAGLLLAREEMAVEKTVLKLLALFRLVWAREKATEAAAQCRQSVRQIGFAVRLVSAIEQAKT